MSVFEAGKGRRLAVVTVLILVTGLVAVSPVWAWEGRAGDEVIIGPDQVIDDDLYVAARIVTIDGTVKGDVIAGGQQITINGTVEGDLMAAGQAVVINGTVNDDARIAGQVLLLGTNARVGDDVIAAGFSLEHQAGSTAGGDLLYAGYQTLLAGSIGEDVTGGMAALELRGTVGGNVDVQVDGDDGPPPTLFTPPPPVPMPEVRPGLTLADSARIDGSLSYESSAEGQISALAQIAGDVIRKVPAVVGREVAAAAPGPVTAVLNQLRRLVSLLSVGLVLMWAAPTWTRQLADTVQTRPLPSFGWGIVAFLVFLFGAIAILVATIIVAVVFGLLTLGPLVGLVVGLGLLADAALIIGYLIFVSYVPQVAISSLGGRLLLERIQPTWAAGRVVPLVVGLVLFVIVTAIPLLGWLIRLIVILLGLGTLWIWGRTTLPRMLAGRPAAS